MADPSKYDLELERILVQLAGDYSLPLVAAGWQQPGDLQMPLSAFAEQIQRHALVLLAADKHGYTDQTLLPALRECARCFGHLYDYVVAQLFSSISSEPLAADYYEAEHFLVVVFKGDIAPVMEVIGQVIVPFVVAHHRQPAPDRQELLTLADQALTGLYADPQQPLREGIIEHVEPMLAMRLRPLPLHRAASPEPPPAVDQDGGPVSTPPEPPAREPPAGEAASPPADSDEMRSASRRRSRLRAPIPYWEIRRRRDEE